MAEDAYLALGDERPGGGAARARCGSGMRATTVPSTCGAVCRSATSSADDPQADVAVETLVAHRLLTVDGDSVEVAHEALLREWPRLRAWLDEDVQGRRLHRHLTDAARTWRATGMDSSELYRGTRLDAALDWAGANPADLNEAEQAFLDAGRQQAEHAVADADRRAADKARSNRRLRALLGGVAALLVVALVSGLLFLRQRNRAEQASLETRARELAGLATLALDEDPERAILLGLAAAERTDEPSSELLSALHRALSRRS